MERFAWGDRAGSDARAWGTMTKKGEGGHVFTARKAGDGAENTVFAVAGVALDYLCLRARARPDDG